MSPLPPSVGVVVPTRNSERTLAACLRSLRSQTEPCRIVVVDNHSEDGTQQIARALADEVLVRGPERCAQRNAGAVAAATPILGFIDSDMELEPDVVRQAAECIRAGAGAVIVGERSRGDSFWARVRSFERSFYAGQEGVEAARFFDRAVFESAGRFDETLDSAEDWDLTVRARAESEVVRTSARIVHDEGSLGFVQACRKKAHYAPGIRAFADKHGRGALLGALDRPYLRRPWLLAWPHPLLGLGVAALKTGEAGAVGWRLLRDDGRRSAPLHDAVDHLRRPVSEAPIRCRVVIPAYNEAARIRSCLDSLLRANLPEGSEWAEWAVLDDMSTDATPDLVRQWASEHPQIPLTLQQGSERGGKTAVLAQYHDRLVADPACADDLVIGIDADVRVTSCSVADLLAPLIVDHGLAITFGMDLVDSTSPQQWASAFQMELVAELCRRLDPGATRAYGRYFAYRVKRLADFAWKPHESADDLQLSYHLSTTATRCQTVLTATVLVTPAASFRDFYLQTFRLYEGRRDQAERLGWRTAEPLSHRVSAAVTSAGRHPLWAGAYAFARVAGRLRHSLRPDPTLTNWSDTWSASETTKTPVGGGDEAAAP